MTMSCSACKYAYDSSYDGKADVDCSREISIGKIPFIPINGFSHSPNLEKPGISLMYVLSICPKCGTVRADRFNR